MGMSANQARFLTLTSRQVDLEYRMQQICHRRLRLASELEKVATKYNNYLSDRKLFASDNTMYEEISINNLKELGFDVIDNRTNTIAKGFINPISAPTGTIQVGTAEELIDALANNPAGSIVLTNDIDMSTLADQTYGNDGNVYAGTFSGTFDGQGYTISNMTLNSTQSPDVYMGFVRSNTGTIKNVIFENATMSASGGHRGTAGSWETSQGASPTALSGIVAGFNSGIIDNTGVVNADINFDDAVNYAGIICGQNQGTVSSSYGSGELTINGPSVHIGGIIGGNVGGEVTDSFSEVNVTVGDESGDIGGLVGQNPNNNGVPNLISNCYYSGNLTVGDDSYNVGGLVGNSYHHNPATTSTNVIEDSYSTGTITTGENSSSVGGFIGIATDPNATDNEISVQDSYTNIEITTGTGSINTGAFAGNAVNTPTFTNNNYASDITTLPPVGNTSTTGVDSMLNTQVLSAVEPLIDSLIPGYNLDVEENLRNGTFSLAREADIYTQSPINIAGQSYEKVDWRTVPTLNDDLNRSNDIDAETEYETSLEKVNAQDKKLQLEQTQIEVEYKAVTTEKDAVNAIIKKNTESSFKTFS